MCDDEIFERRLLLNGPRPVGDDDRLNILLKLIFKWSTLDTSDQSEELYYNKIMQLLATTETESKKSFLLQKRMRKDLFLYKCIQEQLSTEVLRIDLIRSKCKKNLMAVNERMKLFKDTVKPLLDSLRRYPSPNASFKKMHIMQKEIVYLHDIYVRLQKKCQIISHNIYQIGLVRKELKSKLKELCSL